MGPAQPTTKAPVISAYYTRLTDKIMKHGIPVTRKFRLGLNQPGSGDNQSHEARVRAALENELGSVPLMPISLCRRLSSILPDSKYSVTGMVSLGPCGWEVVDVVPATVEQPLWAMAIDLGSTTVVFYLIDMESGTVIDTVSRPNPQRAHGEDILDRILFAGKGDGLKVLQSEIMDLFNTTIAETAARNHGDTENIHYLTVAGNTTMCHFLFALDPSNICKEPYLPSVNHFDLVRSAEVGIRCHDLAWLYCFPNIGSYFGGDLIAGILASGMHLSEEISILVDVGTNAEVVLGNRDWLVACAGAAGPALEGGILTCGMRAQAGAIERIDISPDDLSIKYQVIGGGRPKGLCGSAIIDLLSAMFMAGIVDPTGKLVKDRVPGRVREINGEMAYVLVEPDDTETGEPVYITQSDIKNLIRSKGAMYTILNVVIQSVGIDFSDIENFYVAGAFGNYIDPVKAISIGMLPDIPVEKFKPLGNSAGEGAVKALLDVNARKEVEHIMDKLTYLEMNVRGDFMNQLTAALFLPHTDRSLFPSVKVQA